jgi:hypothetical protein
MPEITLHTSTGEEVSFELADIAQLMPHDLGVVVTRHDGTKVRVMENGDMVAEAITTAQIADGQDVDPPCVSHPPVNVESGVLHESEIYIDGVLMGQLIMGSAVLADGTLRLNLGVIPVAPAEVGSIYPPDCPTPPRGGTAFLLDVKPERPERFN